MASNKSTKTPTDYFRWPHISWLILIPSIMFVTAASWLVPSSIPVFLGPVGQLARYMGENYNEVVKSVFLVVCFIHAVQATWALQICRKLKLQFSTTIKWFAVILVMGTVSFNCLRAQHGRMVNASKKSK